jgi:hypothetical protein
MACMQRRPAPHGRLPPPPSERRRHRRVCPGEPPETIAVTLDEAALGQSTEPHGDRALVAAGCLHPQPPAQRPLIDGPTKRPASALKAKPARDAPVGQRP